jgi:glycine/D-amino acid oxidase-like deaminating enzyme
VAGNIREDVWVLNGLGSKGSLYAPWAAGRLVDALVDGKPLESALSVDDYFAKLPPSK